MIRLTNMASYKAYFKDIATKHVDIAGYQWGDETVIKTNNRSNITGNFLWARPYEKAQYGDKGSDNVHKRKVALVSYFEARNKTLFSSVEAQVDHCEAIIEEIVARIILDKQGKDVAGVWQMIVTDINSFSTRPVEYEASSTPYIGCELELTFSDNANLEYNKEKWTDTLTPP
jgi:hypothetical protein